MLSFKSSLPVFLVLSSLISPLALRADQSQPDQSADLQQATEVTYLNLQSDPAVFLVDDTANITAQLVDTDDPIMIDPIEISPISQPIQLPVTATPIDQPLDPGGSAGTAVTPEPSGLVLLGASLLCTALLWYRRGSPAMTAC